MIPRTKSVSSLVLLVYRRDPR